jgi:hypothetical protein
LRPAWEAVVEATEHRMRPIFVASDRLGDMIEDHET